jgi:hypothetical protein
MKKIAKVFAIIVLICLIPATPAMVRAQCWTSLIDKNFMARVAREAQADPKILAALSDASLPISPAMAEVIKRIEPGPKILGYLYDQREDALRI